MRAALIITLALAPASAGAFDLSAPIDCDLGEVCFIQNHFDHDPSPAAQDFGCGALTYDGHDGTDYALPSLAAMEAGVAVLAAASGRVRAVRDGMADISIRAPDAPPLNGQDCGNGLAIDHGNGWETQYCHLKQGSLAVKAGDQVETGDMLGLVGLSGNTEFPHVHLTLRRDGVAIDPYAPDLDAGTCTTAAVDGLVLGDPPYVSGGFYAIGLETAVPDYEAVKFGPPQPLVMTTDAPALAVWAYYLGAREGDMLTLRITGPAGEVITQDVPIARTQAQAYRAVGKRRPGAAWPAGAYLAEAVLTRADGTIVDWQDLTVTLVTP